MPSASTARPASPSTKTVSSLWERTIPGWDRLATSRGERPLEGTEERAAWVQAEFSGKPSAPGVRAPRAPPVLHGPGEGDHQHDAGDRAHPVGPVSLRGDPGGHRGIAHDEVTRQVAEQPAAGHDQDGHALDDLHDELRAEHDQRNADEQP